MAPSPSLSAAELADMRKTFNEKLFYFYHERQIPCNEWRKREWVEDAIQSIENFYKEPNKLRSKKGQSLAQNYEVSERNGKKIIRIRKKMNRTNMLEIIAMEDYFDILYDAHIKTNHGDALKTSAYILDMKVFMPLRALHCFISLCKVCVAKRRIKKSNACTRLSKRHYGLIELLDMRFSPDGAYNFILYYKDVASECIFLRPLRFRGVVEVSEELLKLFLQIGCPGILITSSRPFAEAIILRLSMAWPECQILCGKLRDKPDETLTTLVKPWMIDNSSKNWSKGIYYLANQINNSVKTKVYGNKTSPLKRLLNKMQTKCRTISREQAISKELKYEEDLEKLAEMDRCDETSDSSDVTDEIDEEDDFKEFKLFDKSLPGPSKMNDKFENPKKPDKVPDQSNECHVKRLPIKTYTKKAKTQVATTSQKVIGANVKNLTDSNVITSSKTNDPTLIKKTKTQTVQKASEEEPKERVLCINKRLKGLTDFDNMSETKRKRQQSWNTPAIDLPHNYPTDKFGRKLPITLSKEIFYLANNFGDITTALTDSLGNDLRDGNQNDELVEKTDNSQLEGESSEQGQSPNLPLCTIVKVESLATDE